MKECNVQLPAGLLKVTFDCTSNRDYSLPESVLEVVMLRPVNFTHPTTLQHLILRCGAVEMDLSHHRVHRLTIGDSRARIMRWPWWLTELEFAVSMRHPLRVAAGCRIVGERLPANVIME